MVTFSGWKSVEMNETLTFHGVTEITFPSIMRRSVIINCKERFESAQRQQTSPWASQRVPCSLSSSVSCAAAFRQKIERYAEGSGDGGLARSTMRAASGLPAEDVAFHPDGAGHVAASQSDAGVVETVAARQVPGWLPGDEEGLVGCRVSLVTHWLERGWDFCSKYHVSRLHQDVWRRVPARDRVGTQAEGERVVEGATTERQVLGAVDPAHPHGARRVGSLPTCAGRR